MSTEEARKYVQQGLDRRSAETKRREADLDDQARQLLAVINDNHTVRTRTEAQKREAARAKREAEKEAKRQAKAAAQALENAAVEATRQYIKISAIILLATALTPFPWWGFLALTAGLAVFPTVYIFRLYYPMEGRT